MLQGGAQKAGCTGALTRAHPLVASLLGRMSHVDARRAVTFLVVHPSFPSPCVCCWGRCEAALRGGHTGTERALLRRYLCASICRELWSVPALPTRHQQDSQLGRKWCAMGKDRVRWHLTRVCAYLCVCACSCHHSFERVRGCTCVVQAAQPLVANFARRAMGQAKALPARGGIYYESKHLTGINHPGKAGNDWGTGYFPLGNKALIGSGVFGIIAGGIGIVLWSSSRQLKD